MTLGQIEDYERVFAWSINTALHFWSNILSV